MPTEDEALPVRLLVDEGIAEIRSKRPEVLTAIHYATACVFRDAVASADPEVRVIMISDAGRTFSSGGNLDCFHGAREQITEAARIFLAAIHAANALLRTACQPVLA